MLPRRWWRYDIGAGRRMSPIPEAETARSLAISRLPPVVKTLGEYFVSRGVPAYLVGGVVRDALLGRQVRDIDLAVAGDTRGLGQDLAGVLGGRCVVLDSERGVVRLVVSGSDGGLVIDLSPISNGIIDDLGRRDFTLDATGVALQGPLAHDRPLEVIDPHRGVADLEVGLIRAVSPSVFTADPARLMRAPRLAVQLGFRLEDATAEAVRRDAHLVATVAPERVRDELLKLLAEPGATSSLRLLDGLGLLCAVIPEMAGARGVTQPKEHYWDVFDHCIETAGQVERLFSPENGAASGPVLEGVPRFEGLEEHFAQEVGDGHSRLTMLKLAGLLHDVAKPAARTVEDNGRIRFIGHHRMGAEVVIEVMTRLRFSKRATELVSRMVEHHLRPSQMAPHGELPTARAIYRYYRAAGDAAIDNLYLNLADYLAARGPDLSDSEWAEHCRTIRHILDGGTGPEAQERLPNLIDGHDIMNDFRLEPGPQIGRLLGLVSEAQASGEIDSRDDAIRLIKATISSGDGGA